MVKQSIDASTLGEDQLRHIYQQWLDLLRVQLHGKDFICTFEHFLRKARTESELLVLLVADDKLVATAQASRSFSGGDRSIKAHVEDVAVVAGMGGQGCGKLLMTDLFRLVKERWGQPIRIELTNSPSKRNAGFYQKLSMTSRGPESEDPTIVWFRVIF